MIPPTLTISLFPLEPEIRAGSSLPSNADQSISRYRIQMAFDDPEFPEKQETINHLALFNFSDLAMVARSPETYGSVLTHSLLANPPVREYFESAWTPAQRSAVGLRIVVSIDPGAPELHSLRWETLVNPRTGQFLFADANLPFSRYLEKSEAGDWKPYRLRPKGELRALVIVANPKELLEGIELEGAGHSMQAVDVKGEVARARQALKGVRQIHVLAEGESGKATLKDLLDCLRQGFDILYMACHGALLPDNPEDPNSPRRPYILLEKDDGSYDRLPASEIVDPIGRLPVRDRPRLAVLASCQSAGLSSGQVSTYDNGSLSAFGPLLSQSGIPAVVAMQDNVKMKTVEAFMPAFFSAVIRQGNLENAMALGRSTAITAACKDWWAPVLFTRLRDGQMFIESHVPGDPLEEYLEAAAQPIEYNGPPSRKLKLLWDTPFTAHLSDQAANSSLLLNGLIQRMFSAPEVDRYKRAVLLGSNGQGKTPALKRMRAEIACQTLALIKPEGKHPCLEEEGRSRDLPRNQQNGSAEIATDALSTDPFPDPVIPILLSLNDLHSETSILDLAVASINQTLLQAGSRQIKPKQFLKWAGSNPILFLIDDLEALITWRFGVGLDALTSFVSEKPFNQQQFLIACRKTSYQGQLGSVNLIELDDLPDAIVKAALGRTYFSFSPPMQKLAGNRSMLRLIVEVEGQKLNTKGQLMRRWVERNLGLQGDQIDGIDSYLIKTLLEQLAFEMRCDHTHVFSEEQIMKLFNTFLEPRRDLYNWREVLRTMRNIGALEREAEDRCYFFADRSYADYFSAAAAAHDPDRRRRVIETASDYWWRDMLEIQVGLDSDPTRLLYELIDRDVLTAGNIIEYANIRPNSPVYSALVDGLVERMELEDSSRRKRMVDRINESDHERAPEVLLRRLYREWSSMVILSIIRGLEKWKKRIGTERLVQIDADVRDTLAQDYESFAPWLRIEMPQSKDNHLNEDADHQQYLQQLISLVQDKSQSPRLRSLAAMSLGLTHNMDLVPVLLERVQDPNENDQLAWCATEALTELQDPNLYQTVCTFFDSSNYQELPRHRARFIYLLGWVSAIPELEQAGLFCGPSSPKTLLMNALADPHPSVRGFAIHTLTRLGFKDSRLEIQNLLEHEQHPLVLRKIAEALGQIGIPDTIRVLETKMKNAKVQENQLVRSAYHDAIDEIKERFGL